MTGITDKIARKRIREGLEIMCKDYADTETKASLRKKLSIATKALEEIALGFDGDNNANDTPKDLVNVATECLKQLNDTNGG